MSALLLLLSLSLAEAPRPDTKTAIHEVVIEVAALTEAKDYEGARALLDAHQEEMKAAPLRTWFERWRGEAPAALEVRALLTHARGVMEMQAGELDAAAEALARARAEAGPGLLRLGATYDLGVLHLEEGELYRAQIPELSNGAVAPPPAAPADGEEQEDPLDLARAQYLKARAWFIERLSLDWRDADTQANVELVQRRLRELDELERQREEQEQEQEEQEQQEGDGESEEGEEGEESSEDEEQSGEDSQENAEGEREPEEPEGGEGEEEEEQEGEEAESESEPEELHLTQEEMQRLLDALREIEEKGEEVQEALRRVGRQGVDRDW
jgi:hypothetical protein